MKHQVLFFFRKIEVKKIKVSSSAFLLGCLKVNILLICLYKLITKCSSFYRCILIYFMLLLVSVKSCYGLRLLYI